MKKWISLLLSITLLATMLVLPVGSLAETDTDLAEWTVMLYLCGTDLETGNGAATFNLK